MKKLLIILLVLAFALPVLAEVPEDATEESPLARILISDIQPTKYAVQWLFEFCGNYSYVTDYEGTNRERALTEYQANLAAAEMKLERKKRRAVDRIRTWRVMKSSATIDWVQFEKDLDAAIEEADRRVGW